MGLFVDLCDSDDDDSKPVARSTILPKVKPEPDSYQDEEEGGGKEEDGEGEMGAGDEEEDEQGDEEEQRSDVDNKYDPWAGSLRRLYEDYDEEW